jgi:hypothetical protein
VASFDLIGELLSKYEENFVKLIYDRHSKKKGILLLSETLLGFPSHLKTFFGVSEPFGNPKRVSDSNKVPFFFRVYWLQKNIRESVSMQLNLLSLVDGTYVRAFSKSRETLYASNYRNIEFKLQRSGVYKTKFACSVTSTCRKRWV